MHDLVRRSLEAMEAYEDRLCLLAESRARRQQADALRRELGALRRRLERLEGAVGV